MYVLLTIIHIIVCIFLTIVVLLQSGKAADLAGAFGGMGSQTAFGPRGSATLLSKATTVSAVIFMCTSLALSILTMRASGTNATILERKTPAKQSLPAGANQPAPAGQGSIKVNTSTGGRQGPTQQLPLPPKPAPAKK